MAESPQTKGKLTLCKYNVANMIFMYKDVKVEMNPSNILSIELLNDYEYNIRSILKVALRLDIRQRMWILLHKREIVCKLEFDKIGMDPDIESFNTGKEAIWNLEFGLYFSDEDESSDTKMLEERLAANETTEDIANLNSENYFESQNTLDVYLFNKDLLNASNRTYNNVFTEGTVQEFVGRMLTATKHKKVLMSPIENDETYKELLIPANPAYKGLSYLEQYYGLYKTGAVIFYDVDCLYILNTNGKVTAKRKDEWVETNFLITRVDTAQPGNGMIRKKDEKVFYVTIPEENINPQKFTITKNAELGSEAKIVIVDDTVMDLRDADQSYIDQRNQYTTYIKKDDNKFTPTIIKARMEENEYIMYISGTNFDITAFTPNKTYKLIFEETSKQEKYGKFRYRLAYAYHFFKAETNSYMDSSHQIVLKKCGSADDTSND